MRWEISADTWREDRGVCPVTSQQREVERERRETDRERDRQREIGSERETKSQRDM